MQVDPKRPTLYLQAKNLWKHTTVVVFGVNAPLPGEHDPDYTELCVLDSDEETTCKLPTKLSSTGFQHAGIAFAITAKPHNTGTVPIIVRRDEDTPTVPPFDRPVYQTVELKRASVDAEPFIEQVFVLTQSPQKP
jgi:hypothetical protein